MTWGTWSKASGFGPQIGGVADVPAASGWTPLSLGAKLMVFYDPNEPTSITGNISQLNDLSGNADHLVQANGPDQPPLNANAFGSGHEGVEFGGGAFLITAAGTVAHPGTSRLTIAGVATMNPATCSAGARLTGYFATNDFDAGGAIVYRSAANTLMIFAGANGATATIVDNVRFRYIAQCNGANSTLTFDGSDTAAGTFAGTAFTNPGRVVYGAAYYSASDQEPWGGFAGPLIVCNDTLTAGEKSDLDAWLAAWNV